MIDLNETLKFLEDLKNKVADCDYITVGVGTLNMNLTFEFIWYEGMATCKYRYVLGQNQIQESNIVTSEYISDFLARLANRKYEEYINEKRNQ